MCHACVTDSVKRRMLSRRDVLAAAPAAAAAAVVAPPAPALAAAPLRVEDLTHELHRDFPTYFGIPGINLRPLFSFEEDAFNINEFVVVEHTGTHMDAPLHFSADGLSVAEVPVGSLLCPLAVIDIRAKAEASPGAEVTPDDLRAWTAAHGPIPEGACVAMLSGWERHLGTPRFRGEDAEGRQHYPGFHVEAALMLLEETSAAGIATDTLSLDIGESRDFPTHYAWLPANRWGLECVASLDRVPAAGATLMVGVPKVRGASGFPARVVALL